MPSLRSLFPPRGLTLAAIFAAALSATAPARAAAPDQALPAAVRQLLKDLRAIVPGAVVTDDEKEALAADLGDLAGGLVKPSAASLEQLADDLAAAASGGQFTHKVASLLAGDLAAVLNSAGYDPATLDAVLAEARTILAAYGIDAATAQALAADLAAIVTAAQTDGITTRQAIVLRPENIAHGLLMTFIGDARLATVATEGQAAQSVLTVDVFGLAPVNPYTVSITRRSDGGVVVLGTLTVQVGPSVFPWLTGAAATPLAEILSEGTAVFGGSSGQALPPGFDPADVARLSVTDANGVERLAGNFADPGDLSMSSRLVNLRVDAGAADEMAAGTVSFRVKTVGAKTHEAFLLYVSGLPAKAEVTLMADGQAAGTFVTTAEGRLVIARGPVPVPTKASGRMLPVNALPETVDLNTLASLALTDASGEVLASAGM